MKGLILCAGRGTRLQPFSNHTSKVLLPVMNKPIIHYGIEKLVELHIQEIGIVIRPDQEELFMKDVGNGERWNIRITYMKQWVPLGIADAVKQAETFIDNQPFILLLGDNLIHESLRDLYNAISLQSCDAAVLLGQVANPRDFGIAEVQGDQIVSLEEKPANPKSDLAMLGVYAFQPSIFQAVHTISPSARGEYEITDAISWMIHHQFSVSWKKTVQPFSDVGTMDRWLEANQWMLKLAQHPLHHSQLTKFAAANTIIPPVHIDPSAELIGCIIGPFVTIGASVKMSNCTITNSIFLANTVVTQQEQTIANTIMSPQTTYVQHSGG